MEKFFTHTWKVVSRFFENFNWEGLLIMIIILVGGYFATKAFSKVVRKGLDKANIDFSLSKFLVNAIKIAIEQESEVLTFHSFYLNMMQRSQRYYFIFFKVHYHMVYFYIQRATLYPYEFIQAFITPESSILMIMIRHRYIAIERCIKTIFHNS